MKKYILSVLVCLLGLSHLQADNISVANVTIEPGQSATVAISLNNTEANLVSFQMDLTLPTGISINKSGCSLSSRFTDEDQELTIGKQGTNVYRLTSTSFALIPITGTSGEIITLSLTASDNSEGGTATLSNIRFVTSESGKVVVSDASFSITVATPSPAITFVDSKVKELCVANWDTDDDGELSEAEAAAVADLGEVFKGNTEITSFDELAYFTGMTTISADAFSGCTSLTSVKLPSTVTSIGHGAFWNCGQLASIDFNGCKASIKYDAFEYCTSLVNVTLPSGTYPDGYSCFYGCTSLESFVMEASDNLPDKWPEGTFAMCTNLETVVVYGKVLRGPNNFRKCTSLQTVTYLDNTPGNSYNQNFREAASGIQFIIPEGLAETFLRQGYVNLSDKSALPIAREEFEDEVARIETMATAVGCDATALSQAISEARTTVNNATDYPTVFAQIAAVKEAAREFLATATLTDEFDVTAAYVTNPDITRFDIGWQTSSGWMTAGYQTANYTNGDVSIDHFVEMQKGDGALPDGEINQTISQLPAGKYRLEADVIAANALSNAEVTGVSLYMGEENTAVATEDKKPQHFSVEFINSTTRDVEIGINIVSTTANWVAADNFQLYYLESLNGVITDLITDATEENPANLTALIQNPSFSNDNGEGWLGDEAEFNEENSHPNNARFVHSDSFDFYQNLSGLPNGRYVLKVKGFHRPGTHDNAYADYIQGNNNASAVVYANSCSKVLPHIATGAQDALPDGCKSIDEVTYNNQTQYIPRNMNDTRIFFGMGLYENELPVTVTDGTLRIGIKLENGGSYHMVAFDDFRLYYLGQDNNITFADGNVKTICVANWDTNGDGELSEAEAAAVTSLGEVFKGNTEITSFNELAYFTGLTTIDGNAFDLCSKLSSVVFPQNITTIGYEAFKGTALTSVVVPEGVTEIIDRGFADCTSMVSATLPSSLTTLRQGAFINCSKLESINLPKSIIKIGLAAFRACSSLNSIDLSGMTVTIDAEAFIGTGLEELTIPATVTLTGWTTFGWCNSLKTVTVECGGELPNDIFRACAQLETAVLPSASAMREASFFDCPKLNCVTFLSREPSERHFSNNFQGCPNNVLFIIPEGTAESFLKKGFRNLSDKSALYKVKEMFENEKGQITEMADNEQLTDGDKTALSTAISEASEIVNNADDYLTVYAQIDAIKDAGMSFLTTATLPNNFDVTAATITNSNNNYYDIGWTIGFLGLNNGWQEASYDNGECVIENYIEGWYPGNTLRDGMISQTITNLPAGIYRLEADIIATNQNDANSEVTGISLFAGSKKTSVFTENKKPQHFALTFDNAITQNVNVGISCLSTNANWVAMDNVRLYYVDSAETLFASASSEHPVDVTSFIINPSFVDNNADGWEGSEPQFQSYNNAEFYQTTFDIHQTISGLPNGNYLLKVKGFHRPGQNQDVFTSYNEGTNNARAELYANAESKTLVNQAQYAQDSQAYGGSDVTYNNETSYVPNSMQEARRWFDAGYYENELPVTVTDGTLTIGIRLDESVGYGWVIFDDFQLAFLGQEQQSTVEPIVSKDEILSVAEIAACYGKTANFTIDLTNVATDLTACQFELTLPIGITLATNDKGKFLVTKTDRFEDSHSLVTNQVESSANTYRVASLSFNSEVISGTSGAILNAVLAVDANIAEGTYEGVITNIAFVKVDGVKLKLADAKFNIVVTNAIKGDVNGDGDVDIADAVCIVNHVVGKANTTFMEATADANGDGDIDIADAVHIVNYVVGKIPSLSRSSRQK